MANTGNGAKDRAATAQRDMVASSTPSQPNGKQPTRKTKSGTAAQKLKPVSQAEAMEMFRSALVYMQISGVPMRYKENAEGLLLQLDGVRLDGVRFVVTPNQPMVSSVVALGVTEVPA